MFLTRLALAFAVVFTLLFAAGCKNPCRRLAEQLCECTDNTLERESCIRGISQRESAVDITEEDEAFCRSRLEVCNCEQLDPTRPENTPERIAEAKRACGLAR